jgi:hypothetical protein
MKKRISLLSCVLIVFALSCGGGSGSSEGGGNTPVPDVSKQPEREWTIIVHIAADNNIDYSFEKQYGILTNYLSTLETVKANNTNNDINIVVMLDCYNNDVKGEGYVSKFKDGYYWLRGNSFMSDLVGTKSEINSGSVADEEEFLAWAARNFPAKRYMYSVFNHGGGFDDGDVSATYGIGFDDSNNDALSHHELAQCVDYLNLKTGKKLSIFYPYACLMGGVELAYELRDKADYLMFSEESFPAEKWSYEALGILNTNVNTTSLNLAKNFCDSAYSYFSTTVPRTFTLSVIDLSSTTITPLYSALDGYATQAISYIGSDATRADVFNNIARSSFSMMSDEYEDWYYVDLGNYMTAITGSASITSTDVKNAASAVNTAMAACVLYHKSYALSSSTGMSIFQNIHYGTCYYDATTYKNILAFGSNKWADYVSAVYSISTTKPAYYDSYEPDNGVSTAKTISIGSPQSRGMHAPMEEDLIKFTATVGMTYTVTLTWASDQIYYAMIVDNQYYYDLTSSSGTMSFVCPISGTYYIYVCGNSVGSVSGGKGSYTVSLASSYAQPGSVADPESSRTVIAKDAYGRITLKKNAARFY